MSALICIVLGLSHSNAIIQRINYVVSFLSNGSASHVCRIECVQLRRNLLRWRVCMYSSSPRIVGQLRENID